MEWGPQGKPPTAIVPLGTGNDLSRSLYWGGRYKDKPIRKVLHDVEHAAGEHLDRSVNGMVMDLTAMVVVTVTAMVMVTVTVMVMMTVTLMAMVTVTASVAGTVTVMVMVTVTLVVYGLTSD